MAGLVQGIALVTFPAASSIFTSPAHYDLSATQYGAMFIPQVVVAITTSLLGAELLRRVPIKRVLLAGLTADLVSMALLLTSQPLSHHWAAAYGLLLAATAALGAGFGLTVPALNTLTAGFHPDAVDGSVLVLNTLLGLGTALAPVFVAVFDGLGLWWGLPALTLVMLAALLVESSGLPFRVSPTASETAGGAGHGRPSRSQLPARLWLFAAFAVLYGICETVNGNWSEHLMTAHVGASSSVASLALTAFWVMVTAGRLVFALVRRWLPTPRTYHLLPFVLAGALVLIAFVPHGSPVVGVVAFALAGLGCSALLPLTISFGQQQLTTISAMTAGAVIAFYQVGYGIAAFGAGPLQSAGISLSAVYGWSALLALVMGALSFRIARRQHVGTSLHPRPAVVARSGGNG